jgi:serine phosphatase RsbU (regulator of sigma subunit)
MPFFHNEAENLYSWKLEGLKQEWTEWSNRHIAEYINLREGDYTFLVKAMNIYGNESQAASYQFSVNPPWYRTIWAYLLYLLLASAVVYIAIRLGQYRLRKKNERLELIVAERTEEIRTKNKILTIQKEEITDSIQYAERIQRAVLPAEDSLVGYLPEYFILLKPKYYVSGDFYWLAEDNNRIIVAAADCTGHGVPGAFMSMLGVSFLNKIIRENGLCESDKILNELRKNIIAALKSTGKEGEQKDGMDIALCVIDLGSGKLQFAGANNPLYLVRRKELLETRGDKMPVAYYPRSDDFTSHNLQLSPGDVFYLFSDGYADQFGGPKGKKFMNKQFRELLTAISDKPMAEQKRVLEKTVEDWMTISDPPGTHIEQTDDILVIGIRI